MDVQKALSHLFLFRGIDFAALDAKYNISAQTAERIYSDGELIMDAGYREGLPVMTSGSARIISGDSESISFDGNIVNVAGATIEIYNTLGVRVAKGTGSVSAAALTPGTYVVVATDASGRKTSRKIAK